MNYIQQLNTWKRKQMKINFVSITDDTAASYRFRTLKPYELLSMLGHQVSIKKFPDLDADINIFQKHAFPEQVIQWMKNVPTKKLFDVCDDHFDREFGWYYKEACTLADELICTNPRMEKRLKKLFPKKKIHMVFDPINTIWGPHKAPIDKPKLIWFGHVTNFQDALPWLKEAVQLNYDLTVVSNMNIQAGDFTFIPYQNGWVEENLHKYDVVLLPTGNQPWVNMKSENRFVDALNAGCSIITNNDILYKDLVKFGIYETGSLSKAMEKYHNVQPKTFEGKLYIQEKYNDEEIKNQWKNLLS